ncbi:MAG: helix-turn-helix domain-containing protein, partial [Bacteroidota bacterium]
FRLLKLQDVFSFKSVSGKSPFESHRISFFTILMLIEGEMTHEVDFVSYDMVAGDCLFISKEQVHKFDKRPSYKGYVFNFTEKFMLQHFSLSAYSKISVLSNRLLNPSLFRDFGDLKFFIGALENELSQDLGLVKDDVVASMLTVFLLKAQLHTSYDLKSYHGDFAQFYEFQDLVASKFRDSRSAIFYASLLNMPYKQLNKLCRIFTNSTAKEYINSFIILEAKRILAATEIPVKEIAYECGFKESTNFIKFFKKLTGTSPGDFRGALG